jgi:uncharacterized membrane protein
MAFHHPYHAFHEGWHGVLWWLFPLLFVAAATLLVIWLVVRLTGRGEPVAAATWGPGSPVRYTDAALDHARLRYARGEISRDDFFQLSADLGGPPPARPAGGEPPVGTGST